MTTPDSSAVERALANVAATLTELNELQLVLEDRTSGLADQILLLGVDLREARLSVDRDLVRRLYWDAPSLPVKNIYEAFDLRGPNDVCAIAGPREFRLPCRDCEVVVTRQVTTRTQLAKLRGSSRCETCVAQMAERERQRQDALVEDRQRRSREERAAVRRAMEDYVLAYPDLPEEPPGGSMFVELYVPERGSTPVALSDLIAVRADLRDRLRAPDRSAGDRQREGT